MSKPSTSRTKKNNTEAIPAPAHIVRALPFSLPILYEDNHLVVVNKPVNLLVQGDSSGDPVLLDEMKEYIRVRDSKPGRVFLGVIHRLDRPVSGLVILAKTGKALSRMNEIFRRKEVTKTYWAIVGRIPDPPEGRLAHYLRKNASQNKSYVVNGPGGESREAILSYRLIGRSDRYFLLEVDLETGRHHQIRAQLAAIGCPIRGDLKYGYPRSNPDGGISLHARRIRFMHPVKKEWLVIEADPPDDRLWKAFQKLRED